MKMANATILVVEDEDDDWFLLKGALKKVGLNSPVHRAEDGEEAIAYLMGEGKYADRSKFAYPSVIITDLKMPRTDGFAVLEFLKGNPEWAIIPVAVLSGSSDPDDIKKAYLLGAGSYHVKPTSPEGLMHQLSVLHAFWMTCEVPTVDSTGRQVRTESFGKLGERFRQAGEEGGTPRAPAMRRPQSEK